MWKNSERCLEHCLYFDFPVCVLLWLNKNRGKDFSICFILHLQDGKLKLKALCSSEMSLNFYQPKHSIIYRIMSQMKLLFVDDLISYCDFKQLYLRNLNV
ncbi:hypothetical protein B7P43_G14560 [Cryptotermes secundus]|uniref:Uncharacterized protein n=1 Tax=Cryptotermes secundus TaxID=105785 RepID=A0A2J7QYE9_9NEOP|nr:hypothetical protein B7P43_G14560 [Cryptotermes secundus]